jgi:hypothetical protein
MAADASVAEGSAEVCLIHTGEVEIKPLNDVDAAFGLKPLYFGSRVSAST